MKMKKSYAKRKHSNAAIRRMRVHKDFIKLLAIKPRAYKPIIASCNDDAVSCLCDIMYNVRLGSVPLPRAKLLKLKKYRHVLKKITSPRTSLPTRRRQLIQHGGGLFSIVIPAVIGLISTLLSK